ncbi:Uncharacterized protein Adt_33201 [Abeliophyllum distichum]|uniref:Uncharacterized protein n=1 Tax=Abeliophyllum distichum TaxID=126358 RepID=A0ABD1QVJ8_9LAMI
MADVMSHRSDGARDPPQQPPHRLALACESVPPPKRRGISRGIIFEKSYFDLHGDRSPDEYRTVYAAIDRLAADCYRDCKLKAHNHLKAHGPSRPYGEMYLEDWQKCVNFFTSPTFVKRSSENKANWGKAKYPSMQGSKSFSSTRYDDVASSCASLDERAIAKEVLGERRSHVRGVGRVPKGTYPSLDSTAILKAPQGTFHQFSGYPQNNDLRFAIRRSLEHCAVVNNSMTIVLDANKTTSLKVFKIMERNRDISILSKL